MSRFTLVRFTESFIWTVSSGEFEYVRGESRNVLFHLFLLPSLVTGNRKRYTEKPESLAVATTRFGVLPRVATSSFIFHETFERWSWTCAPKRFNRMDKLTHKTYKEHTHVYLTYTVNRIRKLKRINRTSVSHSGPVHFPCQISLRL